MASTTTFLLVSFLIVFGLYKLLKLLGKKPAEPISLDAFLAREKKVRKFWLISFCLFSVFSYILREIQKLGIFKSEIIRFKLSEAAVEGECYLH